MVTKLFQIFFFFFFKTVPNLIALVCCFILSPVETVSEVLSTSVDPSA